VIAEAASAPPNAAIATRGSSAPPSSGIYRISDSAAEIERLRALVREVELKVRLRDDLILELKRALEEQRRLTAASELALRAQREKPAPVQAPDDLKQIRGIGPGFERKLHALQVTRFAQIAQWSEADVQRFAGELSILPQRIVRDGWIESAQAKLG
jgi:predicted flap endonuclease-1-like 5' DNA nuclease